MPSPRRVIRSEQSLREPILSAELCVAAIIGLVFVVFAITGFVFAKRSFAKYVKAHNVGRTVIRTTILSPGFVPPPSPESHYRRAQRFTYAVGIVCLAHVFVAALRWHPLYILTLLICWLLFAVAVASTFVRV